MPTVIDRLPHGARVAILRIRSLGDSVLSTPAIQLLKHYRPDLRLGVAVETRFTGVFSKNPDIEEILQPTVRVIRRFRPHLCLNLHGGASSARMSLLSGAKERAGFGHFPYSFIYTHKIPRAQVILGEERPVHTAEHMASAIFSLGVPICEIPRAQLFADPERRDTAYAVIHPFASQQEKTWPKSFFLQIAQWMKREMDLQPVFISGPGEDLSPFQIWPTVANPPLERTKQLLAGASFFAGNDSGPAHMAAAFGVPSLVIFGPSNPVTWAPWRTEAEVLVSDGPIHNISPERAILSLGKLWRSVQSGVSA